MATAETSATKSKIIMKETTKQYKTKLILGRSV